MGGQKISPETRYFYWQHPNELTQTNRRVNELVFSLELDLERIKKVRKSHPFILSMMGSCRFFKVSAAAAHSPWRLETVRRSPPAPPSRCAPTIDKYRK
jgi:hypothetical protein